MMRSLRHVRRNVSACVRYMRKSNLVFAHITSSSSHHHDLPFRTGPTMCTMRDKNFYIYIHYIYRYMYVICMCVWLACVCGAMRIFIFLVVRNVTNLLAIYKLSWSLQKISVESDGALFELSACVLYAPHTFLAIYMTKMYQQFLERTFTAKVHHIY